MDRRRPRRPTFPRVAFVGAGRVANALAPVLRAAGVPIVSVTSRSGSSAQSLAQKIPGCRVGLPHAAELVVLAVPDGAIAEVATGFEWQPGQAVVHVAGSLGREPLSAAENAGAITGAWHPLQSLARPADDLRGVRFAIEAPPPLDETLAGLSRAVGGVPLFVPPEGRVVYHLGATIVSNYAVALGALAAQLWETIGIDRASAVSALAPLLAGTASNVAMAGLPEALTGPVSRGDIATIDRHLIALVRLRPDLIPVYRALGRVALELASERGLPDDRIQALRQRLDDGADATTAAEGVSRWRNG